MEFKNSKTAKRRRYKSRYHSPHNYKTKRSKSENRAAILIAVATFLVIAALVLVFTFGDSIYSFVDGVFHPAAASPDEAAQVTQLPSGEPSSAAPTQAATQAPTQPPTQPPTQAPTEPAVKQSAEFEGLIGAAGLNLADLSGSQMIFVQSAGTSATVYTYEKNVDGLWVQRFSPIKGYVGEGGVSAQVGPADMTVTPTGTYHIEYAMGINSDPGTALKYYRIDSGIIWVTNPAVSDYNRWIRAEERDESIGEWLPAYTVSCPYALVFDYNRGPEDTSKGSFKLLHVGSGPTKSGGIGIPQEDLKNILLWLSPDANATISIF